MDNSFPRVVSVWREISKDNSHMQGNAFAIGQGYLMTCRHVVIDDATGEKYGKLFIRGNIFLNSYQDRVYVEELVLPDFEGKEAICEYRDDFAILKIDQNLKSNRFHPLHIFLLHKSFDITNSQGSAVYQVSVRGENSDCVKNSLELQGEHNETGCWTANTGVSPGESGSPVIVDNKLVGIIRARSADPGEGRLFIVPYLRFSSFVAEHLPKTQTLKTVPGFKDKYIPDFFKAELKGFERVLAAKLNPIQDLGLECIEPEEVLLKMEVLAKQKPYDTLRSIYSSVVEWGDEHVIEPAFSRKIKLLTLWVIIKGTEGFIVNHKLENLSSERSFSAPKDLDADVLLAYFNDVVPNIAQSDEGDLISNGVINYKFPETGRDANVCVEEIKRDIGVFIEKNKPKNKSLEESILKNKIAKEMNKNGDYCRRLNTRIDLARGNGKNYFMYVDESDSFIKDVLDIIRRDLKELPIGKIDENSTELIYTELDEVLVHIFDEISHAEG